MDYSIILINRYRQEKAQTEDNQTAMKEALIHAFSSIASSSMTTVVGLLMLVFMSFKIGMDLGIVLAKGVFISMLCVMSIMPGVILAFDKLIQKTAKKELHIPMNWAAGFSYRMRPVIGAVFILFFAVVCFMQSRTEIAYTLQSEDPIAEVFPTEDTLVVIYDSADEEAISQLSAELEENNNIKSVMGYYTQLARPYTAEELAEKIAEMSDSMTLDSSVIGMLYYNYYESGNAEMMTVSDFLHFISDVAVENDTFSGYIDEGILENIEMIGRFSDPDELTKALSAEELADFLGMDADNVNDMLLYYSMINGNMSANTMTLAEFIDFVVNEVAADENYGAMFDANVLAQMEQSTLYIDENMLQVQLSSDELAGLFGMEPEQAEQLYLLYSSRHGDTSEGALSVKEFIDFLNSYILADDAFSNQLDADTADMLTLAQKLMDAVIEGKTYTAAEMNDMFTGLSEQMDADMIELLYLYASSDKSGDPTWTMSIETLFNYLVDTVLNDSRFAPLIDEDMRDGLYEARDELADGRAQLVTDRYSRLIITSTYATESPETTAFLSDLLTRCETMMDGDFYLIGNSAMTYEMQQSFDSELLFITLLTAAAIFLIVALTCRSLFIPLLLVLLVQSGVYATVSFIGLQGGSMYYLALLIVEGILMGATIDYGILFTNYYRESRRSMPVREALSAAYAGSTHTILTSGLILILVTAILANFFSDPTIAAIVKTISIGSLCAVLLILFVLPGLLALCDRFVIRKEKTQ